MRAAIEASAQGAKVGVICKSLLGKAHTVMAEGGMAAAMANVDDRDNWRVHFADTMRGGQYLNNWRMAELHAKEAPDRVRELEAWGAVFDRTKDGRILQRNFGGHRYPRLAHVGDRTGLEMIRTLQDHGVHQGLDVYMEHTVIALLTDERPRRRRGRLRPRARALQGVPREGRRHGDRRPRAARSASRATAGSTPATATRWRTTPAPRCRTSSSSSSIRPAWCGRRACAASSSPKACAAKAASSRTRTAAGSCSTTSRTTTRAQTADNEEEGWRYTQGDKTARRPPELLTRDHVARCINREVKAGRGIPHGGVFLDIAWIKEKLPNAAEHIKRKLPSMYHQFKQLADLDITTTPMEIGPTTHYTMGGIRVDGDTQMSTLPGLFAAGEAAAGLHGANRLGGNSLSDLVVFGKRAGEYAAAFAKAARRGDGSTTAQVERGDEARAGAVRSRRRRRESVRDSARSAGHDAGPRRHRPAGSGDAARRSRSSRACSARAERAGIGGNREYNSGWHTAIDLHNLLTVSEAIARAAIERKESRGAHFRDDYPEQVGRVQRRSTSSFRRARTAR